MLYKEIAELVSDELQFLEQELGRHLSSDNPLVSQISEHIRKSGGKRIRPVLVLLCCKMCDYQEQDAILYAAVTELIHTATLLHDDVIDEAATRRGVPSANNLWGNKLPVLVGDYLYSTSSLMVIERNQPKIVKMMAGTIRSVVDGELLETFKCGDFSVTEEEYFSVVSDKTASLFAFCCQIGGILGKKENSQVEALANFGRNLGIAFQLVDDLFDLIAQPKKLGKPVGNDIKEGNITLPLIHLLKQVTPAETERIRQIFQSANGGPVDITYIKELLERYESKQYILGLAAQHIQKARQDLSHFDDSAFTQALLSLADYVIDRDF